MGSKFTDECAVRNRRGKDTETQRRQACEDRGRLQLAASS